MPGRSHTGPSLPQSLLEEINEQANSTHKHKRKGGPQLSRKEARKQARETRKQRKAEYFSVAPSQKHPYHGKRRADGEPVDSPQRKRAKIEPKTTLSSTLSASEGTAKTAFETNVKSDGKRLSKPRSALEKLTQRSQNTKTDKRSGKGTLESILRTPLEEEEDAYIAYLERKLGWVKGGKRTTKYGKGEEDDGLDELLNDLDTLETAIPSFTHSDVGGSQEHSEEEPPNEDGFSEEEIVSADDDMTVDFSEEEEINEEVAFDEESKSHKEADEIGEVEDEWHGIAPEMPRAGGDGQEVPQRREPASKYVPPHLRRKEEAEKEELSETRVKLIRQLKGLLNRMSEQNIASIVDGVEEVYRNNRRHDVTETLTKLIIEGISSHSMLLDQYVVLHAAFISALHKLVGIEFAAFFVQHVITSYDIHFAALDTSRVSSSPSGDIQANEDPVGKECSNLVVLLSELYNFQVISCVLMYDVIRALLEGDLTEFKVELLLKVARNSGQQLRQDDPTALKSIIQIVHSKLPQDASALSSRTRFMVETLSNLKNNRIKKAAGQTAGGEAVERMKKFLSGLSKKRHVMSHEPLRVSLEDLRTADTKGKWWLVGAAWGGDPLVEHQSQAAASTSIPVPDAPSENALLKLAKKQGMNTDIRRGIFVVLMSSDDYVDACERLSQLKLTEVQQREIVRVILHCCGNEKQYNPYYALVGQQLCRLSHSHKITLQFCLWDFLRDIGETTVGGAEILKNLSEDDRAGFNVKSISTTRMRNVARAFGWWVAKDCCTLAILKPVDFTVLKPQTQTFLKEMFTHVFANTQLPTPLLRSESPADLPSTRNKGALEEIFLKGTKIQTLAIGLVYFIREAFRKEDGFLKWASQVALETLRTAVDAVPVI